MSDVLQSVQEVYKKWESKSVPNFKSRYSSENSRHDFGEKRRSRSIYGIRSDQTKTSYEGRNRKTQRFTSYKMPKFHGIAEFKMAPTIQPVSNTRPLMGLCCQKCLPQSRAAIPHSYIHSLCICNLLCMPFEEKNGFSIVPTSLRPMYYILCCNMKFRYPDISYKVLQSDRVVAAVKNPMDAITNCKEPSDLEEDADYLATSEKLLAMREDTAKNTLKAMTASVSPFLLRISAWALYNALRGMFNSIQIHKGHIEMLKGVSEEDCPMVYVPVFSSHLDPFLISLILYMNNLKVPLIATGETPKVPVFGKLMQFLGSFFTKKQANSDDSEKGLIYHAVLQSYIDECLKAGYSLEVFIEGRQSQGGKSVTPMSGLLSAVVHSVLEGSVDDAYIIPVAVSYEKIAKGCFVPEQLGNQKASGSFMSTVFTIWKSLFTYLYNVRVDFCQPFSLKEYLQSSKSKLPFCNAASVCIETPPSSPNSEACSSGSSYGNESASNNHWNVVRSLTEHIIYDATQCTALMSTQLVSFLFLTKHRQGATQPQLVCSLNWLREELVKRKHDVGFTGESGNIVKHAVSILGKDLISTEALELEWTSSDMENNNVKILFHKPVIKLPHVIELRCYASFAVPVFLLDSIVVNALYAVLDDEICHFQLCESKLLVSRQELLEKATELCNLLQFEFVCIRPCGELDSALSDVIDELLAKDCLHATGAITYASGSGQKILTKHSNLSFGNSDEEEDEGFFGATQQHLKVDLSKESVDYFEFLRSILSPYIESYWLASCTLLKLLYEIMEEKEFIREIQRTAEDRLYKGLLAYEESFGTGSLRNALKLFELWHVVEFYRQDDLKFLYLSESYDCEEKINNVILRTEEFRK